MSRLGSAVFLSLFLGVASAEDTLTIGATDLLLAVDNGDGVISEKEFERAVSLYALDDDFHGVAACQQRGTAAAHYDINKDNHLSLDEAACWLVANDEHLWTFLSEGQRPNTEKITSAPMAFWKHAARVTRNSFYDACTRIDRSQGGGATANCAKPQRLDEKAFLQALKQNASAYPPHQDEQESKDVVVRVGRKLNDSIALGVQSAPGRALILSYSKDREEDTERLVLNGSVQLSHVVVQEPALNADGRSKFVEDLYTLNFDVDQERASEDDTISFEWSRVWHGIPVSNAAINSRFGWNSSLGATYNTDRNWDRDVYQVTWKGLLSKSNWGRMGYPLADHGGLRFAWQPTLEAQIGRVADDGGNEMLAKQKDAGTYYRLIPKLEAQYWPRILDDRVQIFASAARVHDYALDKGFGQYSADVQFRIAKEMWVVATYEKGRSSITLDNVDRWLLGFGLSL